MKAHFEPKLLITDKGEIDRAYLVHHARARAVAEYGRPNPPGSYVRPRIENLECMADFERAAWRKAHGLKDDRVYVNGFTIQEPRRMGL